MTAHAALGGAGPGVTAADPTRVAALADRIAAARVGNGGVNDIEVRAETDVVGAVLLDPDRAVPAVQEILGREDFHHPLLGRIFAAAVRLWADEGHADALTLIARLADDRELQDAGGFVYLTELQMGVASTANARHHADIIVGAARRRRQLLALDDAKRRLQAGEDLPEDLLAGLAAPSKNGKPSAPPYRWARDIEPQTVGYVWYPYLPRAHVAMLDGDPDAGKSYLTCAIAAALSLGMTPSGGRERTGGPARSLICTAEDDAATTVIPRLQSMGADLSMVAVREEVVVLDADGLALLDRIVAKVQPEYVVLDTLTAFMGGNVDMHRANECRGLFAALRELAACHNCAVQPLRHLNKQTGGKAIYRGLGSIDIVAACRSVMLAGSDPDAPERRVLLHTKSNLSAKGQALGYRIDGVGLFTWTGPSDMTAGQLLGAGDDDGGEARHQAEGLLIEVCRDEVRAAEVIAQGLAEGISRRTLQRTAGRICDRRREGFGKGSVVWWKLRADGIGAT